MKSDWLAWREATWEQFTLGALVQWIEQEESAHARRSKELLSHNPPSDALCRLRRGDQEDGPFVPDQIRKMWDAGQIKADATYTFDALGEWFPVRNMFVKAAVVGRSSNKVTRKKQNRSPLAIALFALATAAIVVVNILPDKRTVKADNPLFTTPDACATVFRRASSDPAAWSYANAAKRAARTNEGVGMMFQDSANNLFRSALEREITASVKAGNAVRVSKGTRVEVLGQTVDSEGNSLRKVKLLSGPDAGTVGYIISQGLE